MESDDTFTRLDFLVAALLEQLAKHLDDNDAEKNENGRRDSAARDDDHAAIDRIEFRIARSVA